MKNCEHYVIVLALVLLGIVLHHSYRVFRIKVKKSEFLAEYSEPIENVSNNLSIDSLIDQLESIQLTDEQARRLKKFLAGKIEIAEAQTKPPVSDFTNKKKQVKTRKYPFYNLFCHSNYTDPPHLKNRRTYPHSQKVGTLIFAQNCQTPQQADQNSFRHSIQKLVHFVLIFDTSEEVQPVADINLVIKKIKLNYPNLKIKIFVDQSERNLKNFEKIEHEDKFLYRLAFFSQRRD